MWEMSGTHFKEKGLEHGYDRLPILRPDQFDGVGTVLLGRHFQGLSHFLCQSGDRI